MATRKMFLAAVLAAAGSLFVAPAALAQVPPDPTYVGGTEQVRTPVVGGTQQVSTPARAQVAGASEDRLPVTGGDVLTLVAAGVGLIALGWVLRYRRQIKE